MWMESWAMQIIDFNYYLKERIENASEIVHKKWIWNNNEWEWMIKTGMIVNEMKSLQVTL